MKHISTFLIISMLCANVYAQDDGKDDLTNSISKPNEFYVATAHIDGNASTEGDANHPPEAIPDTELPKGGGISLTKGDQGQWRIRVFKFIPSQIVATVDQDITIHFVGTQGPSHKIKVDGIDKEIELRRGEIATITLHLTKTGTINFRSLDHQPTMSGQITVIAK
jgi:plastocyanin